MKRWVKHTFDRKKTERLWDVDISPYVGRKVWLDDGTKWGGGWIGAACTRDKHNAFIGEDTIREIEQWLTIQRSKERLAAGRNLIAALERASQS